MKMWIFSLWAQDLSPSISAQKMSMSKFSVFQKNWKKSQISKMKATDSPTKTKINSLFILKRVFALPFPLLLIKSVRWIVYLENPKDCVTDLLHQEPSISWGGWPEGYQTGRWAYRKAYPSSRNTTSSHFSLGHWWPQIDFSPFGIEFFNYSLQVPYSIFTPLCWIESTRKNVPRYETDETRI